MKKLLSIFFLLLLNYTLKAQGYPITQSIGSDSTLVTSKGALKSRLINYSFTDTTQANTQRIKQYPGAQIFTTSDSNMWYRTPNANKWVQFFTNRGGTTGDTLVWKQSGNYVADRVVQPVLGTKTFTELPFITNDTTRMTIGVTGIRRTSSAQYKYVMIDTASGGNFYLAYGDGGSGSSYTFTNGLTNTAGTVKFGGTLVNNTIVDGDNFDYEIDNFNYGEMQSNGGFTGQGHGIFISDSTWIGSGDVTRSRIVIEDTDITVRPFLGRLIIDSLNYTLSTTGKKIMLRDTATGLVQNINPALLTPSLTSTQIGFGDGSNLMTSSSRLKFVDALYPELQLDPNTKILWTTSLSQITGDANGLSLTGASGITSINTGAGLTANFSSSGSSYSLIDLYGLITSNATTVLSNTRGNFDINRTVGYAVSGNNYHGYTDQTDFRLGAAAFNSFGSFVKFGNNRTNQDHYAGFQNVWGKDSTNTITNVYGFVNGTSTMAAGNITNLYGYYNFNPTVSGGTITNHYGVYVPTVTGASNNYGAYFGSAVGIGVATPSATLDVVGTLQYVDGNQSNGYVLTSDASGNATWQVSAAGNLAAYTKQQDTITLATFGAGARFQADTAAFTDSTLYGAFYNDGSDSLIVSKIWAVMSGGTSDTLGVQLYYNDSLNVIGSAIATSTLPVNSTTTGNSTSTLTNQKIPPGNWVWCKSPTVVAGRKPYFLSVSMIGYKSRRL